MTVVPHGLLFYPTMKKQSKHNFLSKTDTSKESEEIPIHFLKTKHQLNDSFLLFIFLLELPLFKGGKVAPIV